MRRSVLLFLAAVPACGGGTRAQSARPDGTGRPGGTASVDGGPVVDAAPPPGTEEHSGSRVQVIDWMSGTTDLFRKELRDTSHDVPCSLERASDGVTRCLPIRSGDSVAFTDDHCTKLVVLGLPAGTTGFPSGCGEAPPEEIPFVSFDFQTPCQSVGKSVVTRGPEVPLPAALYGFTFDGTCATRSTAPGLRAFEAVPSPPSEWTGYRQTVLPITARLGVEMWKGEDGSVVRGGPHLLAEDAACDPVRDNQYDPSSARCLPSNRFTLGYGFFGDAQCTEALYTYEACTPPPIVVELGTDEPGADAGQCTVSARALAELGDEVPASSVSWIFLANPCSPAPASAMAGVRFRRAGARVPRARFPVLTMRPESPGTLGRMMWTEDGENVLPVDGIAATGDAAGSGQCTRYTLRDGTTVCASWGTLESIWLYGDPSCDALLGVSLDQCGHAPAPRWVADLDGSDVCGEYGMREVLGIHEGPVYAPASSACTETVYPDPAITLHDLGPKVPAVTIAPTLEARSL